VIIWPPSRWNFLDIPATFQQPKLNASSASDAAAGGSAAALTAAMDNGTPVQAAGSALPLTFGFAGAESRSPCCSAPPAAASRRAAPAVKPDRWQRAAR